MAYQRAYLPMKVINISQGYGSKSSTHKNSFALDLCGKDSGKDQIFAPFDCKVAKVYAQKGHSYEVWLVSTKKVLCANGYYGILTMSITHPSEIKNMKVGQKFKQNQIICHEGSEGTSSGNHVHIELSMGESVGWEIVKGDYVNKNRIKSEEYLFAYDDATFKNLSYKGTTYQFKKEKDMVYKVKGVPSEPLNVRDVNGKIIGGLKNGDEVINFGIKNGKNLIYHYSILGYIAKGYLVK